MPKNYEHMSTDDLQFLLDYGNLTDEDEARILRILRHRNQDGRTSPLHTPRPTYQEAEESETWNP